MSETKGKQLLHPQKGWIAKESKPSFWDALLRSAGKLASGVSETLKGFGPSYTYTYPSTATAVPNPTASPTPPQATAAPPRQQPTPSPSVLGTTSQPSPTSMPQGSTPMGRSHKFRSAYGDSVKPTVETIVRAANQIGVSPELMLDVAAQESMLGAIQRTHGYHPTQRSASGVFQFTAPTWVEGVNRYGQQLGLDPITAEQYSPAWVQQIDQGRMDPLMNSLMAAQFMKDGMLGRWDASKGVWGPEYSQEELSPYYR